jgi:hypothetical protein
MSQADNLENIFRMFSVKKSWKSVKNWRRYAFAISTSLFQALT